MNELETIKLEREALLLQLTSLNDSTNTPEILEVQRTAIKDRIKFLNAAEMRIHEKGEI